jgi:hypothetical protein
MMEVGRRGQTMNRWDRRRGTGLTRREGVEPLAGMYLQLSEGAKDLTPERSSVGKRALAADCSLQ